MSVFDKIQMIGLDDLDALDVTNTPAEARKVKYRNTSTKLREDTWRQLKALALERDCHLHDLLQEGAELVLKKYS